MIKQITTLVLLLGIPLVLTSCRKSVKPTVEENEVIVERVTRTSGPLSDQEIIWTEEDYK